MRCLALGGVICPHSTLGVRKWGSRGILPPTIHSTIRFLRIFYRGSGTGAIDNMCMGIYCNGSHLGARGPLDVAQEDLNDGVHHAGAKRAAPLAAQPYPSAGCRVHPRGNRPGAQALRTPAARTDESRDGAEKEVGAF